MSAVVSLCSANLISQFDLVQYLDPVERAALCPTCRRRLKSNSDAAAEASSRHESTDLKLRLNAQFGDALRLIGELEALLRERSAGLIEREEERKKEVEAVKAGRQVVRSAAPKLLDSLGGAAPARVKLQAERSGGSAAANDNAAAAAAAAGKPKAVLQFLPQARQNVVMRKNEAAEAASGSLTTVNHSVSASVAGGSAAAQLSANAASAPQSSASVKTEVMSKEAYENLTALLAAQARESSSSSALASSASSSSMDDAFDASAGARADPMVSVGGRPKLASQVDPDDFSLMTDEEQLLYAEAMQEI